MIPDIAVCPICNTNYHTRARLVAHLSETRVRSQVRRTNCRTEFLALNWPVISPSLLADVNRHRNADARKQRKAGHTHTLAEAPARRGAPSVLKGMAVARKLPVWCRYRIRTKTSYDSIINRYQHAIHHRDTPSGSALLSTSPVPNRTVFCFCQALAPEPSLDRLIPLSRPPKRRRVMVKSLSTVAEVSTIL